MGHLKGNFTEKEIWLNTIFTFKKGINFENMLSVPLHLYSASLENGAKSDASGQHSLISRFNQFASVNTNLDIINRKVKMHIISNSQW